MTAYYNEYDPFAAAWLAELMADGLIAPGVIDTRSIVHVQPTDLRGFVQVHLFAGIGIWSAAARSIGWPDDRPLWSASCPCPPFSSAGAIKACPECQGTAAIPDVRATGQFLCSLCGHAWIADDRHLWPEVWRLIRDERPPCLVGEQVASADGRTWLDLVRASLEILAYDAWGVDTCAAGFGSPQIRQRLYWVADTEDTNGRRGERGAQEGIGAHEFRGGDLHAAALLATWNTPFGNGRGAGRHDHAEHDGSVPHTASQSRPHRLAHPVGERCEGEAIGTEPGRGSGSRIGGRAGILADTASDGRGQERPFPRGRDARDRAEGLATGSSASGGNSGLAHADGEHASQAGAIPSREQRQPQDHRGPLQADHENPGPLNGLWSDADWIGCTDGRWRPVEPGTFPLAPARTFRNRVALLRGAGNAVNFAQAAGFLAAIAPEIACNTDMKWPPVRHASTGGHATGADAATAGEIGDLDPERNGGASI